MTKVSDHYRRIQIPDSLMFIFLAFLYFATPVSKSTGASQSYGLEKDAGSALAPSVETDMFESSFAGIRLILPDASTEYISLTGSSIMKVFFEGETEGTANDDNSNGLDDVPTELTSLELVGMGPTLGYVILSVSSVLKSAGGMEETVNNTPGILDVPPFTATGSVFSFFDVYLEIEVGGQILHTTQPHRLQRNIAHKPPPAGNIYTNPSSTFLELLDDSGQPTGFSMIIDSYIPASILEHDVFPESMALITLKFAGGKQPVISLFGTSQWKVFFEGSPEGSAVDGDGDGLDDLVAEITSLNLVRTDSPTGNVTLRLNKKYRSLGAMEELVNNTPSVLDIPPFQMGTVESFFDVYAELQINRSVFHTAQSFHLQSVISHKPPEPGEKYLDLSSSEWELLDESDQPTGDFLKINYYIPSYIIRMGKTWMLY